MAGSETAVGTIDPTVYVVDDDKDLCLSTSLSLRSVGLSVRCFSTPSQFVASYCADHPGCLLLDLRMPEMSGLELLQSLRGRGIRIPVIMLTGYADVDIAVRSLKAGAAEFFRKPVEIRTLVKAIHAHIDEDARQRCNESERQATDRCIRLLTPREHEVMLHLAVGETSKKVAALLGISPKTVDNHRASILEKMGLDNVAELAAKVARRHALDQELPEQPST